MGLHIPRGAHVRLRLTGRHIKHQIKNNMLDKCPSVRPRISRLHHALLTAQNPYCRVSLLCQQNCTSPFVRTMERWDIVFSMRLQRACVGLSEGGLFPQTDMEEVMFLLIPGNCCHCDAMQKIVGYSTQVP